MIEDSNDLQCILIIKISMNIQLIILFGLYQFVHQQYIVIPRHSVLKRRITNLSINSGQSVANVSEISIHRPSYFLQSELSQIVVHGNCMYQTDRSSHLGFEPSTSLGHDELIVIFCASTFPYATEIGSYKISFRRELMVLILFRILFCFFHIIIHWCLHDSHLLLITVIAVIVIPYASIAIKSKDTWIKHIQRDTLSHYTLHLLRTHEWR